MLSSPPPIDSRSRAPSFLKGLGFRSTSVKEIPGAGGGDNKSKLDGVDEEDNSSRRTGTRQGVGLFLGSSRSPDSNNPWTTVKPEVILTGRKELEAEIRKGVSKGQVNLHHVLKLGIFCIENADKMTESGGQRASMIFCGAILMEWAHTRNLPLTPMETYLLAKAHSETWQTKGVQAEQYNIIRSNELYAASLRDETVSSSSVAWLEYCKVLQFLGEKEKAAEMMLSILKNFDNDEAYPDYLFYAGGMLKALGDYDQAANYFFEATQVGPPRHFSKMEMMHLLSRNIEAASKDKDDGDSAAYEMVYEHLVMEGVVKSDVSYDEWINDANTWLTLGDKCLLHSLYSLATDLYGQGIMRDMQAFRKPKLWFGFAKACNRCGRTSDAQLSIKQALTIDPHNNQLLHALQCWSYNNPVFESIVAGDVLDILDKMPGQVEVQRIGAARFQALRRGVSERFQLTRGVSDRKDAAKRLSARIGLMTKNSKPLLISTVCDYMGTIKTISVFDVTSNLLSNIKLQRPFVPVLQSGQPRNFSLAFLSPSPSDQRGLSSFDESPGTCNVTMIMRFTDKDTEEYTERPIIISYSEGALENGDSVPNIKVIEDAVDLHVKTDIVDVDVLRGTHTFDGKLYFIHIVQDGPTSFVTFHRVCDDIRIRFSMKREYFDRLLTVKRICKFFFGLMGNNESLSTFLGVQATKPFDAQNISISVKHDGMNGVNILVELKSVKDEPLCCDTFENVDETALKNPNPPSRLKRRLREKLLEESLARGNEPSTANFDSILNQLTIEKQTVPLNEEPVPEEKISPNKRASSPPAKGISPNKQKKNTTVDTPTSQKKEEKANKDDTDKLVLGGTLDDDSVKSPKRKDDTPISKMVGKDKAKSSPLLAKDSPASPTTAPADSHAVASDPIVTNPTTDPSSSSPQVVPLKPGGKLLSQASLSSLSSADDNDEGEKKKKKKKNAKKDEFPTATSAATDDTTKSPPKVAKTLDATEAAKSSESVESPVRVLRPSEIIAAQMTGIGSEDVDADTSVDAATEAEARAVPDVGVDAEADGEGAEEEGDEDDAVGDSNQEEEVFTRKTRLMSTLPDMVTPERIAKKEEKKRKLLEEKKALEEKAKERDDKKKKSQAEREEKTKAKKQNKVRQTLVTNPLPKRVLAKKSTINNNFLAHQQARMETADLLLLRAQKAIHHCKVLEAIEYLHRRAEAAMVIYDAAIAKHEEKLASDAAEAAVASKVAFTTKTGGGKQQPQAKKPGNARSALAAAAAAASSRSKSIAAGTSATSASFLSSENGDATKTQSDISLAIKNASATVTAALNALETTDTTATTAANARATTPTQDDVIPSEDDLLMAGSEGVGEKQLDTVDEASLEENSTELKDSQVQQKQSLGDALQSRFLYKPKKVEMFIPRAPTRKELLKQMKPMRIEDLPPSAFETAEGLKLALEQLTKSFIQTIDPSDLNFRGEQSNDNNFISDPATNFPSKQNYSMVAGKVRDYSKNEKLKAKQLLNRIISKPESRPSSRAAAHNSSILGFYAEFTRSHFETPAASVSAGIASFAGQHGNNMGNSNKLSGSSSSPFLSNPLSFLDPVEESNAGIMMIQSLEKFKSAGYADGGNLYQAHWRRKVDTCASLFSNAFMMKKALGNLIKSVPFPVTKEEAFCALADSNGVMVEALGKLGNREYLREIKLVCSFLPIESIMIQASNEVDSRNSGIGENEPHTTTHSYVENNSLSASFPRGGSIGAGSIPFSAEVERNMHMNNEKHMVGSDAFSSAFNSILDAATSKINSTSPLKTYFPPKMPTSNGSIISSDVTPLLSLSPVRHSTDKAITAKLKLEKSKSLIRLHDLEASKELPHLNLSLHSPAVHKRANIKRLSPTRQSAIMSMGSSLLPFPMPSQNASNNATKDTDVLDFGAPPPHELIPQSLLQLPDQRASFSSTTQRHQAQSSQIAITPFSPTLRLGAAIDSVMGEHEALMGENGPKVPVLCRRDAIRAQEDEILAKSDNPRFRRLSTRYKKDLAKMKEHMVDLSKSI